jgi:hypothetical protein
VVSLFRALLVLVKSTPFAFGATLPDVECLGKVAKSSIPCARMIIRILAKKVVNGAVETEPWQTRITEYKLTQGAEGTKGPAVIRLTESLMDLIELDEAEKTNADKNHVASLLGTISEEYIANIATWSTSLRRFATQELGIGLLECFTSLIEKARPFLSKVGDDSVRAHASMKHIRDCLKVIPKMDRPAHNALLADVLQSVIEALASSEEKDRGSAFMNAMAAADMAGSMGMEHVNEIALTYEKVRASMPAEATDSMKSVRQNLIVFLETCATKSEDFAPVKNLLVQWQDDVLLTSAPGFTKHGLEEETKRVISHSEVISALQTKAKALADALVTDFLVDKKTLEAAVDAWTLAEAIESLLSDSLNAFWHTLKIATQASIKTASSRTVNAQIVGVEQASDRLQPIAGGCVAASFGKTWYTYPEAYNAKENIGDFLKRTVGKVIPQPTEKAMKELLQALAAYIIFVCYFSCTSPTLSHHFPTLSHGFPVHRLAAHIRIPANI